MKETKITNWANSPLKDSLESLINGTTISQNKTGVGVPVTRIESIQKSDIDLNRIQHIENIPENIKSKFQYQNGDIAFSHINSMEHVGKVAIYLGHPKILIHGMNLLRLRFKKSIMNPKFAYYYMLTDSFRESVRERVGQAVNQVSINQKNLEKIKIPHPDLIEQKKIVDKLDVLMARIQINKSRLENISRIENQIFLTFIFDKNELYRTVKLGEYCIEQTDKVGSEWPKYRLIGVSKDEGIVDLRTGGKKTFENYKIVKPGWFIYNPMRVDIGSIAILDGNESAITSPDYVVFSIKDSISPLLLLKFLKSKYGLSEINNNTQGAVRSRLYFQNLAKINFPFSGEKLNNKAELLLKNFGHYNRNQIEDIFSRLTRSILTKAFKGELLTENDLTEISLTKKIKSKNQENKSLKEKVQKTIIAQSLTKTFTLKPTDLHAGIIAKVLEAHEQSLQHKNKLGHVKAEKISHLIEYHLGIDLDRVPKKLAAGPADFPHLKKIEHRAKLKGWFIPLKVKDQLGYSYKKSQNFKALLGTINDELKTDKAAVDKLIKLFLPMNKEQAEVVATVYAAWNNFLIDGKKPSDEQIVKEARENWTKEKLKIDREKFFKSLEWLRAKNIIPIGSGKKVI
jgi:type I restriction enzyme, S subunit